MLEQPVFLRDSTAVSVTPARRVSGGKALNFSVNGNSSDPETAPGFNSRRDNR